jgi:hypothetical protein
MIKLKEVLCVHSVLEHQQQQLYLPEARSCAASEQGKLYGPSRQAAWIVHHFQNHALLGHSPPASRRAAVLGQRSSFRPHCSLSRAEILVRIVPLKFLHGAQKSHTEQNKGLVGTGARNKIFPWIE